MTWSKKTKAPRSDSLQQVKKTTCLTLQATKMFSQIRSDHTDLTKVFRRRYKVPLPILEKLQFQLLTGNSYRKSVLQDRSLAESLPRDLHVTDYNSGCLFLSNCNNALVGTGSEFFGFALLCSLCLSKFFSRPYWEPVTRLALVWKLLISTTSRMARRLKASYYCIQQSNRTRAVR